MIAIIRTWNRGVHVSPVFAIKRGKIIAFDSSFEKVQILPLWWSNLSVFVVQGHISEFTYQHNLWRGYDWVLTNKKLMRALRWGKTASLNDFPEFQKYTNKVDLPEWSEIKHANDAETLLYWTGDFHDATVKKVCKNGNDLDIAFRSVNGFDVTMRFIDVCETNMNEHMHGMIYDSKIEFADDGICWKVTMGHCYGYEESGENGPFAKSAKFLWKVDVETRFYRVYHRNYADIEELYDDLREEIPDGIALIDGVINVTVGNDIMTVKRCDGGYCTYLNGIREKGVCEDQDIYNGVLEFFEDVSEREDMI